MAYVSFDVSEVDALARDLGTVSESVRSAAEATTKREAVDFKRDVRARAKESAGAHGKLYWLSIGFDGPVWNGDQVAATVYPDPAKPQGGMHFETGSINQPPHLDFAITADVAGPRFADAAAEHVGYRPLRDALTGV